jgi:hypothetical protein
MKKQILLSLAAAATGLAMTTVSAKPPTDDPALRECLGKQYYKFNAIQLKQNDWSEDDTYCGNNGARMFFVEGDNGGYTIRWIPEYYLTGPYDGMIVNGFDILDCDGTGDGVGVIGYDSDGKLDGNTNVMVTLALHGPADSVLTDFMCEETWYDDMIGDDVCVIDQGDFSKRQHTKIMEKLFQEYLEEVTWTWGANSKWKVMDIRVYEDKCAD